MGREICPISLLMQKGMCNMSTKKNFLARAQALLLAAVLTLSLLPVSAFAAENDLPQEVTPSVGQNAEVEYIGEELNVSTSSEDSAETGATEFSSFFDLLKARGCRAYYGNISPDGGAKH